MIDWKQLHDLLMETKSVFKKEKGIHLHHIIPKHAGGTDDKNNLILLPNRWHVLIHYIRWRWLGQLGDYLAYNMMIGRLKKIFDDPSYIQFCIKNMTSDTAKIKMINSLKDRAKNPTIKQKYRDMSKLYRDSLDNPADLYKALHTPEIKQKAKEAAAEWRKNNIYLLKNSVQKMIEYNIKRSLNMTSEERKEYYSRGSHQNNPNWKGAYKIMNNDGINFIFYTKQDLMKITGIANRTIDKRVNTNIPIQLGKWSGFKIFMDKSFV